MSPVIGRWLGSDHPADLAFDPAFAWLEGVLEAQLCAISDASDWRDPRWRAGRLFGPGGQYRWQRRGEKIHATLLLEDGPLPAGFRAPLDLTLLDGEEGETTYILWGEWVDPQRDPAANPDSGPLFYEGQIPDVQTYPVAMEARPEAVKVKGEEKAATRACLRIRRYGTPEGADVGQCGEFQRCVSVEWFSPCGTQEEIVLAGEEDLS